MPTEKIPLVVIPRLSVYYRVLLEPRNTDFISSEEIAELSGFNATQVRKDLTYFGQFGTPSKGYQVEELKQTLLKILGTDKEWSVALVGVGNLGSALLAYKGFGLLGFKIKYAFDNDLRKVGKNLEGVLVKDITELSQVLKKEDIKMAIIAVSQDAAQGVVNTLVEAGVRAILNFAPSRPQVPKNVEILNIDLSIELEKLAYFITSS